MARSSDLGPLPLFSTIGQAEAKNLNMAMKGPLSGYIGGSLKGGYWVERLNEEWKEAFGCKHAIACNSATSGLWAAAQTCIPGNSLVWVATYTMSATAACLVGSSCRVRFLDIEPETYTVDIAHFDRMAEEEVPKAIIVTNLFGHPAMLHWMRGWCDRRGVILIEDNAQAPFAMEDGKYTGTIGHVGVFSLNVHKHIQAGEGGVIVTDDDRIAEVCRLVINHRELTGSGIGLNLRMTEPIAAIASAQLKKGPKIVQDRIDLAGSINMCFRDCELVRPPVQRAGCRHVYYLWAGRLVGKSAHRIGLVTALQTRGVPVRLGYSRPLHRIFNDTTAVCPTTERVERSELITFEVCAYDPKAHHLRRMRDIILSETSRILGEKDGPERNTDTGELAAHA